MVGLLYVIKTFDIKFPNEIMLTINCHYQNNYSIQIQINSYFLFLILSYSISKLFISWLLEVIFCNYLFVYIKLKNLKSFLISSFFFSYCFLVIIFKKRYLIFYCSLFKIFNLSFM